MFVDKVAKLLLVGSCIAAIGIPLCYGEAPSSQTTDTAGSYSDTASQAYEYEFDHPVEVEHAVQFSEEEMVLYTEGNYDKITFQDCLPLSNGDWLEAGKPDLSFRIVTLLIPPDHEVESVGYETDQVQKLEGSFHLYPQQLPIPCCEGVDAPAFIEPDLSTYESDSPYPAALVREMHLGEFGGNRIVTLAVFPLQYRPSKGELLFYPEFHITVRTGPGEPCRLRPGPWSESSVAEFRNSLYGRVENPEDIDRYGYIPAVRSAISTDTWGRVKEAINIR